MLTRWLTFTAFLAASASPEREASGQNTLTVIPTCRVKGRPEVELTLKCGDGKNAGVVQYWHTPFGDLQSAGFHTNLDPVFMQHDGSLVIPNNSIHHSGLYYCLLRHTQGTTLWPYQLVVHHNTQRNRITSQKPSRDMSRFRRSVGSDEEKQAGVSDSHFAGAVAASVLLTFVAGFSAGALSRRHVLRCLGEVTTRLRPQRKQQGQNDTLDHGSEATVTTVPPMYTNQAFEMEQVCDSDSVNCEAMEMTISSTTSTPPAKPKRSFRSKQQEEQEPTAYLEGCDYKKQEVKRTEEEEAGGSLEENKMCDGETEEDEEKELNGIYLLGGSQTETDEEESSEDREKDGKESAEWRQEEEVEAGEEKGRSVEDQEEEGEREEQKRGDTEKTGKEGGETDISDQSPTKTTDNETVRKNQDTMNSDITVGEPSSHPVSRNRVIRLYQFDEDGQRYCHLPDPAPNEPGPAPRLKQRSLSLTRLNAIMAAATAGPLDRRDTGTEERQEKEHFHMEI